MGRKRWNPFKAVKQAVSWTVSSVSNVVSSVATTVENTVKAVIKDPIPVIAQIVGASVGIPPAVTAAAVTAARGGDIEDIAKSAAVSFVASSATQAMPSSVTSATTSVGQSVTQSLADTVGQTTAQAAGQATTAALNQGVVGGVQAAITGRDITEGITAGAVSGAVSSSVGSAFTEVQKDPNWGLTPATTKVVAGATSAALTAEALGQDPNQAIANYVANTAIQTAKTAASSSLSATETAKSIKDTLSSIFTPTTLAANQPTPQQIEAQVIKTAEDQVNQLVQNTLGRDATPQEVASLLTPEDVAKITSGAQNLMGGPSVQVAGAMQPIPEMAPVDITGAPKFKESLPADYKPPTGMKVLSESQADLTNAPDIKATYDPTLNKYVWLAPDETQSGQITQPLQVLEVAPSQAVPMIATDQATEKAPSEGEPFAYAVNPLQQIADTSIQVDPYLNMMSIPQKTATAPLTAISQPTTQQPVLSGLTDPTAQVVATEPVVQEALTAPTVQDVLPTPSVQEVSAAPPAQDVLATPTFEDFLATQKAQDTLIPPSMTEATLTPPLTTTVAYGLGPVTVVASPELLQSEFAGYYPSTGETDTSGGMQYQTVDTAEETPSLPTVTVTPEETPAPLSDLPQTVLTTQPVAKVTSSTAPASSTKSLNISSGSPAYSQTTGGTTFSTDISNTQSGDSTGTTQSQLQPSSVTTTVTSDKFESPLDVFRKIQSENPIAPKANTKIIQSQVQAQPMTDYYNYGLEPSMDDIFGFPAGSQSLMAAGGLAGTRYGKYAGGGMATPLMAAGGKMRVDFRHGDAVTGEGDGQSDDIPAMLADGEFVFPADVVAAIGNGSTKAGSDKLYDMMHGIRAHVRSAKPQDLPPEIKSPLQFLKTKPSKARR